MKPAAAADAERRCEARRAAASTPVASASAPASAPAPRLQWPFLVLVALSVLSVWAISSRVAVTTPRFQRQQRYAPRVAILVATNHTTSQSLGAANASLNGDIGIYSETVNSSHTSPDFADATLPTEAVAGTASSAHDDILIPHLIHQSWKTREKIPARFHPWMKSWVELHPTWTYVFWTDADNMKLFELLYPQYLHVARAVGKINLADMARYALLHHLGGLYVDVDFECKKPFDELHRVHRLFLSSEPQAHSVLLEKSDSLALCNALMASAPGHPFWLRVLDNIMAKFDREGDKGDAVALTGPRIVKQTYFSQLAASADAITDVDVLLPEFFYPEVAYWNLKAMQRACHRRSDVAAKAACAWLRDFPEGEFTENTHATHHWQCTWCQGEHSAEYSSLEAILGTSVSANASPHTTSHARVTRPSITTTGIELLDEMGNE